MSCNRNKNIQPKSDKDTNCINALANYYCVPAHRYVIVGSASPDDVHSLDHFDMYRNNESVTPNPRSPLEDYTLHVVDMEMGRLCDSRTFRHDKIYLSHNQGLYLYRHTLAVLSVQHQTIYIFQVCGDRV